ncbi:polysaccharide biosynthesis C-terminal domain-containing protein [Brevundimonas sp. R86498]|uniref:oligosaccharide flippase family protein n=1 Tax=Brevundimonas sp. R86498 TaxID=3093845 RepID=UPI0037C807DD
MNSQHGAGGRVRRLVARVRTLAGSGLVRKFSGSLGIGIGSRILALIMAILVGRQLEPAGYGVFNYALGMGILTGQAATLGLPILQTRLIPQFLHEKDWPRLQGLLTTSLWIVLGTSVIVGGGLALFARHGGLDPELAAGLLLSGLVTPVIALRTLRRQQLIAIGRPQEALAVDEVLPPLAVCAGALLLGFGAAGEPILALVCGSLCGVALGAWRFSRAVPPEAAAAQPVRTLGPWLRDAASMQTGALARLMLNRIDILMLAPLAGAAATGLYSAAFRITYLMTFVPVLLNTILSREFSAAYARGQTGRLRKLYLGGLAVAAVVVGPMMLVLIVGADRIAPLVFGAAYADAGPLLRVLAVSQGLQALSIVTTALMTMTNRHHAYAAVNLFAIALNVVLNLTLIPRFGAMGAAWAAVASSSVILIVQTSLAARSLKGGPQSTA